MGCNSPGATHHLACDCREREWAERLAGADRALFAERERVVRAELRAASLSQELLAARMAREEAAERLTLKRREYDIEVEVHAATKRERDSYIKGYEAAESRAASLSLELLDAIQARDSYRASAELRVGMRREFEELLGCGDTMAPEAFEAGLVRLRALLAAESRAARLAKAGAEFASQYGASAFNCRYDNSCDDSGREPRCAPCELRAALAAEEEK